MIKNLINLFRVLPRHYGCPLRNINIDIFCMGDIYDFFLKDKDDFHPHFKSFPFCPGVTQGQVSGVTSQFLAKI